MTTKWIIAPEEMDRWEYAEYEQERVRAGNWPDVRSLGDDAARVRSRDASEHRERTRLESMRNRSAEVTVPMAAGDESRPARRQLELDPQPVERAGPRVRRLELEQTHEDYVSRAVRAYGVPASSLPATGHVEGRLIGIESGVDGKGRAVILAAGKLYVVRGSACALEKRRGLQVTAQRHGGRVLITAARAPRVERDR